MNDFLFVLSSLLILIPIFFFAFNKKYFYYSLMIIYPIIGQTIGLKVDVFGLTLNPSMIFGILVLLLTGLDFLLFPSSDRLLEALVLIFIIYAVFSCAFSPRRLDSLSWAMKIATWLLMLLVALKFYRSEQDLLRLHTAVSIAVLIVIMSFLLSRLGLYGESFEYETGVQSFGGGYSSGKTLAYYLAMTIPVVALRTLQPRSIGRIVSYILVIINIVVVFLTFVRAPVVALVIGFLAYQFFGIRYGKQSFVKSAATVSAIAIVIAVAAMVLGQTHYMSRWTEMGSKYSEGKINKLGSGRVGGLMGFYEFYVYRASAAQKIFGSGLGSSYVYLGNRKYIHNDFAEILMGCGIIGFTLYMLIMLKVFLMLRRLLRENRSRSKLPYGLLAMANFFMLLAFHMTNVTSGVFIISVWSLFTGATIGMTMTAASKQTAANPQSVYSGQQT